MNVSNRILSRNDTLSASKETNLTQRTGKSDSWNRVYESEAIYWKILAQTIFQFHD